ncbi:MAG TPA: amidase, partial [Beijerinckiaceae bacterium]
EASVRAFVTLNLDGARLAADASTARYKAGRPLSRVDGLPVGIKDIFETEDMPTERGSAFHAGDRTGRDAAHVYALRRGGAVIVGKTVTTEFAMARPGPTRNPFDETRTPGGSSSGTAAGVAAGMFLAGTGSHARGSVIRPASYCGNYAIKPTFGAINRGGCTDVFKSQDHIGVHAGGLRDMWMVARFLSEKAGPDPGHPGLYGPAELTQSSKPRRVAALKTRGWDLTDGASRQAFETFLEALERAGVAVLREADEPRLAEYERLLRDATRVWSKISTYELRWPMQVYRDKDPSLLAPWIVAAVERGETMTLEDYRTALLERDQLRRLHEALHHEIDCYVTLSSPGPAPEGMDVGDAVFNEPSSLLGCPALNAPLLAVDGLPLGVQIMGFAHHDARVCAYAAWMAEAILGAD